MARDRSGQNADIVLERNTPDVVMIHFIPILCRNAVLYPDSGTVMMEAARKPDVTHRAINLAAGVWVDALWHIQNSNSYHIRIKAECANSRTCRPAIWVVNPVGSGTPTASPTQHRNLVSFLALAIDS